MWSNAGWQADQAGWYANKASGAGSPTFVANSVNPAIQTLGFSSPATFTISTGTGMVIIDVQYQSNVNTGTVAVTLNGVTMNLAVQSTRNTSATAAVYYLAGQTANASSTVVVTGTGVVFNIIGIQAGVMTNLSSTTPSATAFSAFTSPASPYSVGPITVPSSGFGVASVWLDLNAGYSAGTGVTIDYQSLVTYNAIMAHMGAGASQTLTLTGTNFQGFAAAFAAWS